MLLLAACGSREVELSKSNPDYEGAVIFSQRCSACHTLSAAGSEGSAANPNRAERTDGPNFNQRKETVNAALYAIRNGGFSGAIMPKNLVTGEDAEKVARFVAKYSGSQVKVPVSPKKPTPNF